MRPTHLTIQPAVQGQAISAPRQLDAPLVIGAVVFWVVFPGFYFYHFMISQGLANPLLGGLFGPALVAAFPFLIWAAVVAFRRQGRVGFPAILSLFIWLVAWASLWMAINFAARPQDPAHEQLATTLLLWVPLFMLSMVIPLYSDGFRNVLWISWIVILALAVSAVDASLLMAVGTVEEAASYQGLARSLMVTSSLLVASTDRKVMRWALAGVSIFGLFLIGARSELYGFLVAYVFTEFLLNKRSVFGRGLFVGLLALGAALVARNLNILGSSRQLEILDLSESTSWLAREYMQQVALSQIVDNPILGAYGGHWVSGEGDYAHNALSVWVSLGLPGFVLYCALCVAATLAAVRALLRSPMSRVAQLATLMNVSTVLLVVLAKPLFWEMAAFAWGLGMMAALEQRGRLAAS